MIFTPAIIQSRIRRRPIGILGQGAKIGWKARISNLTGDRKSLRVGRYSQIDGEIIIYPGAHVSIGDYCYIGVGTKVWAYSSIQLDNYVIIAHNVSIMDSTTHPLNFEERKKQIEGQLSGNPADPSCFDLKPEPIVMEEGVWVCAGATILRGARIQREAIVSAGAVVRGVVPACTMVR